jgi:hypothetical protein
MCIESKLSRAMIGALLVLTGCGDSGGTTAGTSTTGLPATTSTGVDPTTGTPTTTNVTTSGTTTGDSTTTDATTGTTDASSSSSGTTEAIDSSSSSTGDGTTGEPIDCAAIPQGPLPYTSKYGPMASEDLAFDHEGNLIGAQNGNLFRSPFEGQPQLWLPGAGGFIAGLRATAKGVIVYADNDTATLFRVNMMGAKEMVVSGLEYANGLEVDLDGFVYVAEQSGSRVRRVNAETGEFTILADGLQSPNGVSFSPDYRTLYVGSFGGGTIHAIKLKEDMTAESVELFRGGIGGGGLDGMAVDACGNVYVCEFGPATVWRITPDGQTMTPLVELGGDTGWIPNMQWGSGIGGWDPLTLYVLDFSANRVFEVPVGVPDKKRAYP